MTQYRHRIHTLGFNVLNGNGFRLIDTDGARYNSTSISGEIKLNTNQYRKQFAYIRGSKRLWYMKRSQLTGIRDAEVINLNTMTINMTAMHRVSGIARYKPETVEQANENPKKTGFCMSIFYRLWISL